MAYLGSFMIYMCIILQSLSDLDFDLTRSLKFKCDGAVGLSICDLLLVFDSNTLPISAPLRDISLRNLSFLDIDFSRSIKSNVIIPMDYPYVLSY